MNVLSLFDGMSCGQIALERVGVKVDNYFASEVDKHAINVTKYNYPNTIHIGDVSKVSYKDGILYTENENFEIKIDLLIGGSPCQGFSFAGKQLNFKDDRSKLFFEFVRLLNELSPKYFLLENVVMKKEYRDIITRYLDVEPILINSSLVSAQNRKRLYWTNIPDVTIPEDKQLCLESVCGKGSIGAAKRNQKTKNGTLSFLNVRKDKKSNCVVSSFHNKLNCYIKENNFYSFTVEELEMLQTVPQGYTKTATKSQAVKMLGNGWTVDVIAHIFKNIT